MLLGSIPRILGPRAQATHHHFYNAFISSNLDRLPGQSPRLFQLTQSMSSDLEAILPSVSIDAFFHRDENESSLELYLQHCHALAQALHQCM